MSKSRRPRTCTHAQHILLQTKGRPQLQDTVATGGEIGHPLLCKMIRMRLELFC
jgi:hypothetical protein